MSIIESSLQLAVFGGIGQTEIWIILGIVLIVFGPKNLPKLARSMGQSIRDFKSSLSGVDTEIEETAKEVKESLSLDEPAKSSQSVDTSEVHQTTSNQ